MRENLAELQSVVSRRAFFSKIAKTAALVAAYDKMGPTLFGALSPQDLATAQAVYSACCQIVIPVDQDPGWATFEPGISEYGLNVFVGQALLGGNSSAFDGFRGVLAAYNTAPRDMGYGDLFLKMPLDERITFFTNSLTGVYEPDGYGDVLTVAAFFCLLSARAVFFSNYPKHLALDSEFQLYPASSIRTGFDIMGFKGPVLADEEAALRTKNFDAPTLPGIDFSNPWI